MQNDPYSYRGRFYVQVIPIAIGWILCTVRPYPLVVGFVYCTRDPYSYTGRFNVPVIPVA